MVPPFFVRLAVATVEDMRMSDAAADEAVLIADPALVAMWTRGWAASRGLAAPVARYGGWHVDVGLPDQTARLVFPGVLPGLTEAAAAIAEPHIFLKAAAPPEAMRAALPPAWVMRPQGWMMDVALRDRAEPAVPDGYDRSVSWRGERATCRIVAPNGAEVAARGFLALVDDVAIFDRIETQPAHRRRGLARAVMLTLETAARRCGARRGVLVATPAGRALYATLGWRLHSLYATAVLDG